MPVEDYPYSAELLAARLARPRPGGQAMSLDAVGDLSGVNSETLKRIHNGRTAQPTDETAAAIYDGLGATPDEMPLYALARARWMLNPDRAGLAAALAALASVTDRLLADAGQVAIQRAIAEARADARRRVRTPSALLGTPRVEGEGEATP